MKKRNLIFALLPLLTSCNDSVNIPSNKRFYCDPPPKSTGLRDTSSYIYFDGNIYQSKGKYYFVDECFIFHGTITLNTTFDDEHGEKIFMIL